MSKINWHTALATAGLVIAGLGGAVFTSYQILEKSFQLNYEALKYHNQLLEQELAKIRATTEKLKRSQDVVSSKIRVSNSVADSKLIEICRILSEEEGISSELQQYCFNVITALRD